MPPREAETEALRKDRAIRGRLMKISAIEILDVLFNSTYDGVSIFMNNKEA
jgi:hypothetical protein